MTLRYYGDITVTQVAARGVPAFAVVGIDYNGRWDLYRCCFFL